jgi:hypothetical protein
MPDLVLQLDGIGVPGPHAQAAHWPHTRVVPFAARLPYRSLCDDRVERTGQLILLTHPASRMPAPCASGGVAGIPKRAL